MPRWPPTLETLSSTRAFDSLEPEWDELVRDMATPSPYLLHGWLSAWFRYAATDLGVRPAVHVARRQGRLVAALPFAVQTRVGLRIAGFAGHKLVGDSPFGEALLAPVEPIETLRQLCVHAEQSHDCAVLRALQPSGPLATCGADLRLLPRMGIPVVDLRDGYEHWSHTTLSRATRANFRRLERRLGERGQVAYTLARTPDELPNAIEDVFRLHALRWRQGFDTSSLHTEAGREFNRRALAALAVLDVPRVVTLRLDDRAIAFTYHVTLCGRASAYRVGYDPAYARYSPGLLSTLKAIELAAGEGIAELDFEGGEDRYKLDLATLHEPLCWAIGLAGSARGAAYARAFVLALESRARLKRSESLRRLYTRRLAPALREIRRRRQ